MSEEESEEKAMSEEEREEKAMSEEESEEGAMSEEESEEENLPPHVKFWLSPDTIHDCYFIVGPVSGPKKRIGSFKSFLIGYSEPFRAMLYGSELKEKGDISIVDIQPDTFTYFLKCLYMNCDNITEGKVSFQDCVGLLYVADKYLVTHLKEKLIDYLLHVPQNAIELDDVFTALSSPSVLNEKRLEKMLSKMITSKIKEMFSSSFFLNISSDSLLWILKLDDVGGTNEITLWQELLKWAIHNTGSKDGSVLRQHMLKHLQCIRFCTMSYDDFCKKVVPTDILTHTEVYEICKSFGSGKPPNMEFICNNNIPRNESKEDPVSTYVFSVNNIKNFSRKLKSPTFTLQGLKWSVLVQKDDGYLSFHVCCEGTNPTSDKKHSVTGKLVLISRSGNELSRPFEMVYNEVPDWGFAKFCSWKDLVDLSNKYVLYDSITLLVCINK